MNAAPVQPPDVLFVHHARTLGGATTSLAILAAQVKAGGRSVAVLLVDPTPDVLDYMRSAGVVLYLFPASILFKHTTAQWFPFYRISEIATQVLLMTGWHTGLRKIADYIAALNPKIVHLNSVVLVPLAHPLRARKRRLIIHTRESPIHGHFGFRTRWMMRQLRGGAGDTVYIGEEYRRRWGARGAVIYNTISASFESAGEISCKRRASVVSPSAPITFGFLGGVSRIKGSLDLLRAWKIVTKQNSSARLLMGGVPEYHDLNVASRLVRRFAPYTGLRTYWQQCACAWDKLPRLEMRPFERNLERFFNEIDVLIFPAVRDHFPRPVIEAAAFGVGSIVTDLPSLIDVVEHMTTGLVCEAANPARLAETLMCCIDNRRLVRDLGGRAKIKYDEVYATRRSLQALERVYAPDIDG